METRMDNIHDVWTFIGHGVDSLPVTVWIIVISLITGMITGALLMSLIRGESPAKIDEQTYRSVFDAETKAIKNRFYN